MLRLSLSALAVVSALGAVASEKPPEVVRIAGGKCTVGSSVSHEANHKEEIAAFDLAKYVVTNEEYKRFVDATGHVAPEANSLGSKHHLWKGRSYAPEIARQPVVNVSWRDAADYCEWLSKETGRKFRLPSEEEWEMAARGGLKGKPYPWGDKVDKTMAWYGQMWHGPATMKNVDFGAPNAYGFYGMSGNAWQWVADWYVPVFNGRPVQEELELYRVVRGGSWANDEGFLTVGYRNFHPPDFHDFFIGFRVAADAVSP